MEQSTWTPEQCSDAGWAHIARTIEANPDEFPQSLYNAVEHCRTANYYKEQEFCMEELWPIYKDYYDIVNKEEEEEFFELQKKQLDIMI